jgi:transposase InsO family protein/predicted aspartyl protease
VLSANAGLFVTGYIGGSSVKFLVDTGSSLTFLSEAVYQAMEPGNRPVLETVERRIVLADGKSLSVLGKCSLGIELGGVSVLQEVVVADVTTGAILGMDFMSANDCLVDTARGMLKLGGSHILCDTDRAQVKCCRIAVAETVTVPAGHEMVLPGRVVNQGVSIQAVGIIEPVSSFAGKHGLALGRSLVDPSRVSVPLRVLNPTGEDVILYRNTTAGIMYPVQEIGPEAMSDDDVLPHMSQVNSIQSADPVIPQHLQELYDRCRTDLDPEQTKALAGLLAEFQDVFVGPDGQMGRTTLVKHQIDTGNARPVRQAARRLPIHQQGEADTEIQSMLERGVIEPSNSPWASPIVLVKKKDGSTRFCTDYRALNDVTIKDAYPIPRIDDTLDALAGSTWFSCADCAYGYWQIGMDERDKEKTAFATRGGLYQFNVMSMGLCNAGSTFERLMEHVLGGLQWRVCLVYLDDIIVYATTFDGHLARLKTVLGRLRTAGLKLKAKKCSLFQRKVLFLGHVVSEQGVGTDPTKIEVIQSWPTPTTLTEVRGFIGLCSYYRRYIRGFGEIASPLHRLAEKGRGFVWTQECETAFSELKRCLTNAPVLAYVDPGESFILDTDASDRAMGAVLSQVQNGSERVIAYASRCFSKTERRYCVTRRELLAVVYFVKYFRHYLYGAKFLVRTDHNSLRWLFNFKSPEGQIARWLEVLGTFTFDIIHRPGRQHTNADAISRVPCRQCGRDDSTESSETSEETSVKTTGSPSTGAPTTSTGAPTTSTGAPNPESPTTSTGAPTTTVGALTATTGAPTTMSGGETGAMSSEETGGVSSEEAGDVSSEEAGDVSSEEAGDMSSEEAGDVSSEEAGGVSSEETGDVSSEEAGEEIGDVSSEETGVSARGETSGRVMAVDGAINQGEECWFGGLTNMELRERQIGDATCGPIIAWLEVDPVRPAWETVAPYREGVKWLWGQWDQLLMKDGVLRRRWEDEAGHMVKWLFVVPLTMLEEMLQQLHDTPTSGHLGINRTVARARERLTWFGMARDVEQWCRQCDQCAKRKPPAQRARAPLQQYRVGVPMERVAADILGPLPRTDRGNKYALVVVDYFSKWSEVIPIPDQEAGTVATAITEGFVCRFGTPLELHTDQGRNFESALFKEVCSLLGVTKTRTSPLRPQSDGLVERLNRTLENMLSAFVSTHQRDWDRYLPYVMMAYRSTPQASTNTTPNMLMLGREVRLPIDLTVGRPPDETGEIDATEYAGRLRNRMETAHIHARKRLATSAARQKRYYRTTLDVCRFERGDPVWLYNPMKKKGISPKLQCNWSGPFLVVKRLTDVIYRIQRAVRAKYKVVHQDRLKPYNGRGIDDWLGGDRTEAPIHTSAEVPANPEGDQSGSGGTTTAVPHANGTVPSPTDPPRRGQRPRAAPQRLQV